MGTAKDIEILYKIIEDLKGPRAAREFVLSSISNIIFDIQEEKLQVTAEEIEKRFSEITNDFKNASKNQVA